MVVVLCATVFRVALVMTVDWTPSSETTTVGALEKTVTKECNIICQKTRGIRCVLRAGGGGGGVGGGGGGGDHSLWSTAVTVPFNYTNR